MVPDECETHARYALSVHNSEINRYISIKLAHLYTPVSFPVSSGRGCRTGPPSTLSGALRRGIILNGSYLVDPASSHMLVSKIKPCMSKYKHLYSEIADGSLKQLWFI